jgi:hypothetical protein
LGGFIQKLYQGRGIPFFQGSLHLLEAMAELLQGRKDFVTVAE